MNRIFYAAIALCAVAGCPMPPAPTANGNENVAQQFPENLNRNVSPSENLNANTAANQNENVPPINANANAADTSPYFQETGFLLGTYAGTVDVDSSCGDPESVPRSLRLFADGRIVFGGVAVEIGESYIAGIPFTEVTMSAAQFNFRAEGEVIFTDLYSTNIIQINKVNDVSVEVYVERRVGTQSVTNCLTLESGFLIWNPGS